MSTRKRRDDKQPLNEPLDIRSELADQGRSGVLDESGPAKRRKAAAEVSQAVSRRPRLRSIPGALSRGDGEVRRPLLIVDAEPEPSWSTNRRLWREFEVMHVETAAAALHAVSRTLFAVVVVVQRAPGLAAADLLVRIQQVSPETQGLVIAAYADIDSIAAGFDATDSDSDPSWDWDTFLRLVRQAVQDFETRRGKAVLLAQSEQALRERQRNDRFLLEYAPDGIIIADQSGQVLDANLAVVEQLGYSRNELLRLRAQNLVPPNELPTQAWMLREMRSGQTVCTPRFMRRKDGSLINVETSARMLPDGRLQAMVRFRGTAELA